MISIIMDTVYLPYSMLISTAIETKYYKIVTRIFSKIKSFWVKVTRDDNIPNLPVVTKSHIEIPTPDQLDSEDMIELKSLKIEELRIGSDLSLAYRRIDFIPKSLAQSPGFNTISKVDLTECGICDLINLKYFINLEILVLDKNELTNISTCPALVNLHTLWCNNNKITDLKSFLYQCEDRFPKLNYLSIMRNPSVPSLISEDTGNFNLHPVISRSSSATTAANFVSNVADGCLVNTHIYKDFYRVAVLFTLPYLTILDGVDVSSAEKLMAERSGDRMFEKYFSEDKTVVNEDSPLWVWPDGYDPPESIVKSKHKMLLISNVQEYLDKAVPNFRELAESTYFDVNKRVICRYYESHKWQDSIPSSRIGNAILKTIYWRIAFPFPYYRIHTLTNELSTGFIVVAGRSYSGHPLVIMNFSRQRNISPADYTKLIIYSFERAIYLHMPKDLQSFYLLVDCLGLSYSHFPSMQTVQEIIDVLLHHYCGRLEKIFVFNTSWLTNKFYGMISYAISEVTKEKIKFISGGKDAIASALGAYINADQLPFHYGGSKDLYSAFSVERYLGEDVYVNNAECEDRVKGKDGDRGTMSYFNKGDDMSFIMGGIGEESEKDEEDMSGSEEEEGDAYSTSSSEESEVAVDIHMQEQGDELRKLNTVTDSIQQNTQTQTARRRRKIIRVLYS